MHILTLKNFNHSLNFIKDITARVINSYPPLCPLHLIVKDIVYMQAQKGRAGITGFPLKRSFKKLSITSKKLKKTFITIPPYLEKY